MYPQQQRRQLVRLRVELREGRQHDLFYEMEGWQRIDPQGLPPEQWAREQLKVADEVVVLFPPDKDGNALIARRGSIEAVLVGPARTGPGIR